MGRADSFLEMLDAAASMQYNISIILEAKAGESEKSRDWICQHLHPLCFGTQEEQLKQPLEMHEQFVELIDGLTKLENALARNLKVVLNREVVQPVDTGMGGGAGLLGGLGDDG